VSNQFETPAALSPLVVKLRWTLSLSGRGEE